MLVIIELMFIVVAMLAMFLGSTMLGNELWRAIEQPLKRMLKRT